MNCVELQASLVEIEDGRSAAQRHHLKNCLECSALLTELILISSGAVELRAADERGPPLWKSIESKLREEGVIRPQRANRSLVPALGSRWGWVRWMAPAAAALLITLGLYVRQHSLAPQLARATTAVAAGSDVAVAA